MALSCWQIVSFPASCSTTILRRKRRSVTKGKQNWELVTRSRFSEAQSKNSQEGRLASDTSSYKQYSRGPQPKPTRLVPVPFRTRLCKWWANTRGQLHWCEQRAHPCTRGAPFAQGHTDGSFTHMRECSLLMPLELHAQACRSHATISLPTSGQSTKPQRLGTTG